jgi:hypothetical protein
VSGASGDMPPPARLILRALAWELDTLSHRQVTGAKMGPKLGRGPIRSSAGSQSARRTELSVQAPNRAREALPVICNTGRSWRPR